MIDQDRIAELNQPLLAALAPLAAYRAIGYRDARIAERGRSTVATGL